MLKQTCNRCIMDSSIPGIIFDDGGICNYCHIHDNIEKQYPLDGQQQDRMLRVIDDIKLSGKNKKYDCIIGVSGGCDSSYLMYLAKKYELRPLAVTFDNTWGSKISVENIQNVTKKLNIDLHTNIVDNNEFNDICRSFLKASVPDADVPNDIAISKVYYMAMEEFDIEYSLCGHSFRTEGTVPLGWTYMDGQYIESVQKRFGTIPLDTFPNLNLDYWLKNMSKKRIRLLYYLDYIKKDAIKFMQENFGWQWYGGHHFENEYTKFVKSYLLPKKFGIDKRYVEFSALVRSGQKNRDEAIEELKTLPSVDPNFIAYVIKRLGLSQEEFQKIMNMPIKSHHDYDTYHQYFRDNKTKFKEMLDRGEIPITFYEKYTT